MGNGTVTILLFLIVTSSPYLKWQSEVYEGLVILHRCYYWRSDLQRLGLCIFPPFLGLDDKDKDEDEYSALNAVDDTVNSSNGGESPDLRKLQIVISGSEMMVQSKKAES